MATAPACAQDATWTGSGTDFAVGSNWSTGTVPTGTAYFGASNTTALATSSNLQLGSFTLNPGASNYTFTINNGSTMFNGAGVVVNGGSASFVITSIYASVYFLNSSSPGSVTFNTAGAVIFGDQANGGNATFNAIGTNSEVAFTGSSNAGNSVINSAGYVLFANTATGGNAQINGTASTARFDFSTGTGPLGDYKISAGSLSGAGNFYLGGLQFTVGGNNLSTTVTGVISDCGANGRNCGGYYGGTTAGGSIVKTGTGTMTLSGTNLYTGGTTFAGGTVSVAADTNLGGAAGGLTFDGGMLQVTGTSYSSTARAITWGAGGGGFDIADAGNAFAVSQVLSGTGGLTKAGAGTLSLSGVNTYSGATTISAGTLLQGVDRGFSNASAFTVASGATLDVGGYATTIGSLAGAGDVALGSTTLIAGRDNTNTVFSGVISGIYGGFDKRGTGRMDLSGINTYTGETVVETGTLAINGSIAASRLTTVSALGTLGGNGTVGNTVISDGTLAPGNSIGTLTVAGNLDFTSGATYAVEVSPSNADRVNVTGVATLGGATVNASFASGSYITRQYTILNATGGVSGTFGSQVNTNLPTNFTSNLSYDAKNAYLNLTLSYVAPPPPSDPTTTSDLTPPAPTFGNGLSRNQNAVGNTLVSYFDRNGGIPLAFGALTPTGLTQASGESGAGAQQPGFTAATQFVGSLSDPTAGGRGVNAPALNYAEEGDASAYASTGRKRSGSERDAYAMMTKAAPRAATFVPHWSSWVSGFGGSQTTDGNAASGTNRSSSQIAGAAVGADYWLSPQTVAGFALAGGATSFSVTGGGSGQSDLFQVGGFVRHEIGSSYITATAAYGWQNVRTDRAVGAEQLRAQFDTNSYTARLEAGNRFVTPWLGGVALTPYAAAQVTYLDLPAYAESGMSGAGTFALAYAAKGVTSPRTELGLRSDRSFAIDDATLLLRGRAAWAHDTNTDRSASATFQSLPGASFVVNGAKPASDAALTTAEAELRFVSGISVGATFEGEFSDVTRSYAGKGVVRYAW